MKQIKLIAYTLLFAFVSVGISSCKKSEEAKPSIIGGWFQQSVDGTAVRSVSFRQGGEFQATFGTYNNTTPGLSTYTIYSGTYTVKGDSLLTNISTVSVQENGGTPVVSPTTQKLYEHATFSVTTETLTINYDTYPADAPVRTQAVFGHAMLD
ncbi:hypothetical protein IDJ77_12240 [Mucilaginibacter sp. ZT4R22]|uniref:Lipocalin-like domain-containing protein n=1 Tax=Mucilaginibacter pankratovii TaxID=2772110 RepID=A0ABR7WQI6_9SPHI|nr:hypothetical protein [Mucilaginibacter pankratovii]MBD1364580.1 hypothetical protein [Mucilaginibacter pankratovii]